MERGRGTLQPRQWLGRRCRQLPEARGQACPTRLDELRFTESSCSDGYRAADQPLAFTATQLCKSAQATCSKQPSRANPQHHPRDVGTSGHRDAGTHWWCLCLPHQLPISTDPFWNRILHRIRDKKLIKPGMDLCEFEVEASQGYIVKP